MSYTIQLSLFLWSPWYWYGCGYDTIRVCGYVDFFKFRIRYD